MLRMDLKEIKKKIEKEKAKKEKADERIKTMRDDLMQAAFERVREERMFAGGVFQVMPERGSSISGRNYEIRTWASNFGAGMVEVMEALDNLGMSALNLTPKEFDDAKWGVRSSVRIIRNYDNLKLLIGEDVELGYLKSVVKDYGIRVDIEGINKSIKAEGSRYGRMTKLKNKLILSGAAEGLPMCDLGGFENEYLEIEEQYARKLHGAFKAKAKNLELGATYFSDLRHDFELLGSIPGDLFMAMGRAVFQVFMENEDE